jgi:hypothetical protein
MSVQRQSLVPCGRHRVGAANIHACPDWRACHSMHQGDRGDRLLVYSWLCSFGRNQVQATKRNAPLSFLSNSKRPAQLGIGNSQGLVQVVLCRSKIPPSLPLQKATDHAVIALIEHPSIVRILYCDNCSDCLFQHFNRLGVRYERHGCCDAPS